MQCVPNSRCIDDFDPRSGGFESECNIQGDVCCDERNIITKEIEDCMCVPNSQCVDKFDPRQETFESPCPAQGDVCCAKDDILQKELTLCNKYFRDGFECMDRSKCLDVAFQNSNDFSEMFDGGASKATCPGQNQVCCLKEKPDEIESPTCSKEYGLQC